MRRSIRFTAGKNIFMLIASVALCAIPCRADENSSIVTISSCSTSIQDQEESVKKNIFLASRALRNRVIEPGATFSFNDTVGEANEKNGYLNGRVLYEGEIRYEPGGGVCQVSSTLFNALLLAGCTIIERHRHYRPVTYVPPGLDATIKYGKKDLRMKNPHPFAIVIETNMSGSSLIISITGSSSPGFTYDLSTEEDEISVPIQEDSSRIRSGLNVSVFRKKMKGNTVIQTQLLYRDYYPPVYMK